MILSRKKQTTNTLRVFVLETADDSALKEGTLSNNVEDPWVSWGKHQPTRCTLQCTIRSSNNNEEDNINVWQIGQFQPGKTPVSQVFDLQLCNELSVYPVVFQPMSLDCTAARVGKIIKATCRSASSGLAEASTVASVAAAMSLTSIISAATSKRETTKRKRPKHHDEEDEEYNNKNNEDDNDGSDESLSFIASDGKSEDDCYYSEEEEEENAIMNTVEDDSGDDEQHFDQDETYNNDADANEEDNTDEDMLSLQQKKLHFN